MNPWLEKQIARYGVAYLRKRWRRVVAAGLGMALARYVDDPETRQAIIEGVVGLLVLVADAVDKPEPAIASTKAAATEAGPAQQLEDGGAVVVPAEQLPPEERAAVAELRERP